MMMKLKKLNLQQNSETQIVMKLKNSYCEGKKNSTPNVTKLKKKTQIVTKLKNSNGDKTQKLKWGQKSNCDETQIVTT